MAYIGNQTSTAFTSMAKQDITGDGGQNYTLAHAVTNAQEIEVFVNNVRQEPGVAYTVSGTALAMTGNVASTDDFYVVYQGKAIQTSVPDENTVTTGMLQNDAITTAKVADDAITSALIADDAITSALIADDAVKIANINEDFYKIGTWTPTFSTNSGTAASAASVAGYYTKIGRVVIVHAELTNISINGTTSGSQLRITGQPFTIDVANAQGSVRHHTVNYQTGRSMLHVEANTTGFFRFLQSGDNVADTVTDHGDLTDDTSDIIFTVTYFTNE